MKNSIQFQLIVETNSYTGNFERELCAFMTGHTGECGVGSEFVDPEITKKFDGLINNVSDDNGCYRPVAVNEENINNMNIFLSFALTAEQVQFLHARGKEFERTRPYQYLDENFKFLGIKQIKITTGIVIEDVKYN